MRLPMDGSGTDMESARAFFMAANRQPRAHANGNSNGHGNGSGSGSGGHSAGQEVQLSQLPGQNGRDQSQV